MTVKNFLIGTSAVVAVLATVSSVEASNSAQEDARMAANRSAKMAKFVAARQALDARPAAAARPVAAPLAPALGAAALVPDADATAAVAQVRAALHALAGEMTPVQRADAGRVMGVLNATVAQAAEAAALRADLTRLIHRLNPDLGTDVDGAIGLVDDMNAEIRDLLARVPAGADAPGHDAPEGADAHA